MILVSGKVMWMRIDRNIDMNEEFQAENESRFCLYIYLFLLKRG